MAITLHARMVSRDDLRHVKEGGVLPGRRASLESLQLILKCWVSIVFACVAGDSCKWIFICYHRRHRIGSTQKDFISLKT